MSPFSSETAAREFAGVSSCKDEGCTVAAVDSEWESSLTF